MTRSVALLALWLLVGSAACSPGADVRGHVWNGTVDTTASGTVVVRNTATPLWRPGEEWQLVERFRIGQVQGSGPMVFGRIESFDVDQDGRIWVLDGIARELRVFDSAGTHVRTLGGGGAGPGEFEQPVSVNIAPDGTIWVIDVGLRRISVFDSAGTFLRRDPIPSGSRMWPWYGGFDHEGRFYTPVPAAPGRGEVVAYTLIRHDPSLEPIDTLRRPRDPVERRYAEYRGAPLRLPLQGTLRWWLARDGTVWAILTDRYQVFQMSWNGDTLRTVERAFSPVPVGSADREQIRQEWEGYMSPEEIHSLLLSNLPSRRPPITGLAFLDDENSLWVEVVPSHEATETEFDVFDEAGRFLGPVRMPFRPEDRPIVRGSNLYAVTLDELDVAYIVVADIVDNFGSQD